MRLERLPMRLERPKAMVLTKSHSVGIVGVGKLGETIWKGLEGSEGISLLGSVRTKKRLLELPKKLQARVFLDNTSVAKKARILILAVKPQQAKSVLLELSPHLTSDHLVISVCAALEITQLRSWMGKKGRLLRAMPNTPVQVREGMTVLAREDGTSDADYKVAETLFNKIGKTIELEERLFDAATAVSGCGPAFVYVILEALSDGGVKVGLPRKVATHLAAQTLLGASSMVLDQGIHPACLRDDVTTPGGVTIDGLMALEEGHIRVTLIKAIVAATERSRTLRAQG